MNAFSIKPLVAAVSLVAVVATPALAMPSSKFGGSTGSIIKVSPRVSAATVAPEGWNRVLSTTIKTPNQKDLIVGASLETSLTTDTLVKSAAGKTDSSNAVAAIKVRVAIDRNGDGVFDYVTDADGDGLVDELAAPGEVTFDMRDQTLTAKLGGIPECTDSNGDGIYQISECTLTEEEIQLILKTQAAHHFNFIVANLPTGEHAVEVQAMITTGGSSQAGSYSGDAWIGVGSLTVEEVRGISGEGFSLQ